MKKTVPYRDNSTPEASQVLMNMNRVMQQEVQNRMLALLWAWFPKAKGLNAERIKLWAKDNKIATQVVATRSDEVEGSTVLTYVAMDTISGDKHAAEIKIRFCPNIKKPLESRLEFSDRVIPFPQDVATITKTE